MPNVGGTMSERHWERRFERRVHLSEAAEIMGVSKDAIRMRLKNRRIIAALTQRIPELEPPRDPPRDITEWAEDLEGSRETAGMRTSDPETCQNWHSRRYGAPRAEAPSGTTSMPQERPNRSGPTETPTEAPGDAQAGAERVPWWWRIFE